MSSTISYSIAHNGAFIVTHSDGTQVPCHNLTTAKVEAGLLPQSNPQNASVPEQISVEEYYGCELGGLRSSHSGSHLDYHRQSRTLS
jgi:hypothetical protein